MIYKDFSDKKISLSFDSRPCWKVLVKEYPIIKSWLHECIAGIKFSDYNEPLRFNNPNLRLSISIYPSTDNLSILDSSDEGDGLGYFGDTIETWVSEAVLRSIEKKTAKKYQLDYPCILVIYNNTGLPLVDFKKVSTFE